MGRAATRSSLLTPRVHRRYRRQRRRLYKISNVNLSADIVSGSVAGLISGLLVSVTLWLINHFNKPKFEYFHTGDNTGHFYYNRLRPIIIGGSFVICHGSAFYERSPRGGDGGFYLGPKGDQVFSTGSSTGAIVPGQLIDFTYRYAPLGYLLNKEARQTAHLQTMDPIHLTGLENEGRNASREIRSERRGWRQARVTMTPSATK